METHSSGNLNKINLNNLLTLHAILAAGSAAGAARTLHRSQPAVQEALQQCRAKLGDPLLVRQGKTNVLTEYARRVVLPKLDSALAELNELLPPNGFSSRTQWVVMTSDYVVHVVLADAVLALAARVPEVHVSVVPLARDIFGQLRSGMVDLVIMPEALTTPTEASEFDHLALFKDSFRLAGSQATFERYPDPSAELHRVPYIEYSGGGGLMASLADTAMDSADIVRNVTCTVQTFLQVPLLLAHSSPLVSVIHQRLADEFGQVWPLCTCSPPVPIPDITEVMYWRPGSDTVDLRDQIITSAGDL